MSFTIKPLKSTPWKRTGLLRLSWYIPHFFTHTPTRPRALPSGPWCVGTLWKVLSFPRQVCFLLTTPRFRAVTLTSFSLPHINSSKFWPRHPCKRWKTQTARPVSPSQAWDCASASPQSPCTECQGRQVPSLRVFTKSLSEIKSNSPPSKHICLRSSLLLFLPQQDQDDPTVPVTISSSQVSCHLIGNDIFDVNIGWMGHFLLQNAISRETTSSPLSSLQCSRTTSRFGGTSSV